MILFVNNYPKSQINVFNHPNPHRQEALRSEYGEGRNGGNQCLRPGPTG